MVACHPGAGRRDATGGSPCSGGRLADRATIYGRLSTCCRLSIGARAVAQFGSALDWGSSGRRFKSCQPDQRSRSHSRLLYHSLKMARYAAQRRAYLRTPEGLRDLCPLVTALPSSIRPPQKPDATGYPASEPDYHSAKAIRSGVVESLKKVTAKCDTEQIARRSGNGGAAQSNGGSVSGGKETRNEEDEEQQEDADSRRCSGRSADRRRDAGVIWCHNDRPRGNQSGIVRGVGVVAAFRVAGDHVFRSIRVALARAEPRCGVQCRRARLPAEWLPAPAWLPATRQQ